MPEGLTRFQVQLTKLEQILITIPQSTDGGLALYKSSARQYLFYLEALTHIYKMIHNKKRFERMRISFKSLEDQLGKMDYYDGFIKEFSVQENFPDILLANLKNHFEKECVILNDLLRHDKWLDVKKTPLRTIKKELADAKWGAGLKERKAVGETIIDEIQRIKDDYHAGTLNFKDIENGVHEFRRRLRWISIYAQALDGLIQIKQVDVPYTKLADYQTKEVLESPFNKMPALPRGIEPIYIEAPNFYAMSWLIAESGKLKDEGLRIICIENSIRETGYVSESEVKASTRKLCFRSTKSPRQIKETMKVLADKFIHHDKVLDRLMADIRHSLGT